MRHYKVLHIITELVVGGAQDNTLLMVEKHNKKRFKVMLASSSGGELEDRVKNSQAKVVFFKYLQREINIYKDCLAFIEIFKHIKKNKYDIVHTHSSKAGILGRLAAKLAGVPIIIHTIHSFPFHDYMSSVRRRFYIFLEKLAAIFTDKLITVSNLNKNKAIKCGIANPSKFVTVYSGIDLHKFNVNIDIKGKKRELNIPLDIPIVGMIGRLSPQKAPQYFIKAAAQVAKIIPEAKFLLVGDGILRKELENLANELHASPSIIFMGTRSDVPEILSLLDVFALSSLWEGLGRALTEAMIMGIPVVATDVDGVPELVKNGETGLLVPPKNSSALAQAIITLLKDRKRAKEMGEAARKRVVPIFSAELMVKKIEDIYEEFIKANNLTEN